MGKIVISTNVSFDGVVQDPDGEEGFRLGGDGLALLTYEFVHAA